MTPGALAPGSYVSPENGTRDGSWAQSNLAGDREGAQRVVAGRIEWEVAQLVNGRKERRKLTASPAGAGAFGWRPPAPKVRVLTSP